MSQLAHQAIAHRELGELGLSIATDLAIAGAFGQHPDRPLPKQPILDYSLLLINVRTLVRNLLGSIQRERKILLTSEHSTEPLLYEMSAIQEIVDSKTNGKVKVGFFYSHYKDLHKEFPHANLKESKTQIQIVNEGLETSLTNGLVKRLLKDNNFPFTVVDFLLTKTMNSTLLLTHIPLDLLARTKFEKLALLESHTGRVKNHLEWNTRLTNGKELTNIPFNRFTLQVFGDNGVFFSPIDRKAKNAVMDIATDRKWTTITTDDRIRYCIEQIEDIAIRQQLVSLL